MPNWCMNSLIITGPTPELNKFLTKAKAKGTDISLNKLVPYPKKFRDLDKIAHKWEKKADTYAKNNGSNQFYQLLPARQKEYIKKNGERPSDGYNQGGYDWCRANWGTKWDITTQVLKTGRVASADFDSAWCPPIKAFETASKKFPKLEFTLTYSEPGVAFQGTFSVKNGEVLEDTCEDSEEDEAI